ncbi:hypothetical protein AAMO2058_001047900 [Amorphochlora amoebiformis]
MTAAQRDSFFFAEDPQSSVSRNGAGGNRDYGIEYGMHESHRDYQKCRYTERNKGLFSIDQKLKRSDATATRQNPNGNRRGLECAEERDYYPYWRPNIWRDLVVLVSDISFCDYFKTYSQNVATFGECLCDFLTADNINTARSGKLCPIDPAKCTEEGYTWKEYKGTTGKEPNCVYHPFGRDNHLGNYLQVDSDTGEFIHPKDGESPSTAKYTLMIPEEMSGQCVIRMRYNMSTNDYPSHKYARNKGEGGIGVDSKTSCPWVSGASDCRNGDPDCSTGTNDTAFACGTGLTADKIPLYNRPYVNLFDRPTGEGFQLGLAINTHQTGRTFQDRSYVFNVTAMPTTVEGLDKGKRVINFGIRGRRGNIVQSYPAVEYDFTPQDLQVNKDDFLHIQFHGSDFNAARNANNGEGWQYSDRANIVQSNNEGMNYPLHGSDINMFSTVDEVKKWAWVGQDPAACDETVNNDKNQNEYKNCGKLNMSPNRFPQNPSEGLWRIQASDGTYTFFSTRNNNFSNRSHKSKLIVGNKDKYKGSPEEGEVVVGSFAAILGASVAGLGIAVFLKQKGMFCFSGSKTVGRLPTQV